MQRWLKLSIVAIITAVANLGSSLNTTFTSVQTALK
jgi:Flp pilus assembly pilin Flp